MSQRAGTTDTSSRAAGSTQWWGFVLRDRPVFNAKQGPNQEPTCPDYQAFPAGFSENVQKAKPVVLLCSLEDTFVTLAKMFFTSVCRRDDGEGSTAQMKLLRQILRLLYLIQAFSFYNYYCTAVPLLRSAAAHRLSLAWSSRSDLVQITVRFMLGGRRGRGGGN